MSCADCLEKSGIARAVMERLKTAADAHGFELWTRWNAGGALEVLAVPTVPHAARAALVDSFKETRQVGLPMAPSKARDARAKDRRSVKPVRRNDAGHIGYRLDNLPIELVFLN